MKDRMRISLENLFENRAITIHGGFNREKVMYLSEKKVRMLIDDIILVVNTYMEEKK